MNVHADQSPANINARGRGLLQTFDRDRVAEFLPGGRPEGSACLGLGDHIDLLQSEAAAYLALDDQGASQVLTALGRQVYSAFLQGAVDSFEKSSCRVHARVGTDFFTEYFTRRTPDYKEVALLKLCCLTNFRRCPVCLAADRFQILFLYMYQFRFYFLRTTYPGPRPGQGAVLVICFF
jgi:hypothetical protein